MELQSFTSLFEIYSTFCIAYVLIDEFKGNPFVLSITKHILRKYKKVDDIFNQVFSKINGIENSFSTMCKIPSVNKKILKKYNKEYLRCLEELKAVKIKADQSYIEINTMINSHNITKVFVYLNCYLFFYCLTILILAGLYTAGNSSSILYKGIDNGLLILNILTTFFLVGGWIFDQTILTQLSWAHKLQNFGILNGYLVSFFFFSLTITISILSFNYSMPLSINGSNYHNYLIIFCVFIPLVNFFVYIFKAKRKADKNVPNLIISAKIFLQQYSDDLKRSEELIGHLQYYVSKSEIDIKQI